jgi:reactive intermediate/imine deaminase
MNRATLLPLILSLAAGAGCAKKDPVVRYLNPAALSAPNGYTHVVEVAGGKTLYLSGQIALNKDGALIGKGDLKAQTQQVFENLKSALAASGATLDHVVKITVFMTDVSGLQTFREVRDAYFTSRHPASSLVQVSSLVRPELLIEIEAVAVIEAGDR